CYAKAYLLPDTSSHSKKKTTVKRKTLNPVFDQTLKYKISVSEVRGRTLNLSVWHAASLGRNLFLGEVELELAHWDWTHTDPDWYKLQPRLQCSPESISSRGNIMLSIKFTPAGSEVKPLELRDPSCNPRGCAPQFENHWVQRSGVGIPAVWQTSTSVFQKLELVGQDCF
ncbi:synaptotagmin-like protein 1, partial [Oncorhynchus clarkii lewisi]|uniref:synaptotagmin-like protein 1 n=1 Tax=Oncorhynchus clarkii lewisi TaxID=490388 RepID=UPI0039B99B64